MAARQMGLLSREEMPYQISYTLLSMWCGRKCDGENVLQQVGKEVDCDIFCLYLGYFLCGVKSLPDIVVWQEQAASTSANHSIVEGDGSSFVLGGNSSRFELCLD
jgi:hypothetical protein